MRLQFLLILYFIYFIFQILLVSCRSDQSYDSGEAINNNELFSLVDTIVLKTDSIKYFDYITSINQAIIDNKNYLYLAGRNEIVFYNVPEFKYAFKVTYPDQEPNSIGPFSNNDGYFVFNEKVYFMSHSTGSVFELGLNGEILNKYTLNINEGTGALFYEGWYGSSVLNRNEFIINTYAFDDYPDLTQAGSFYIFNSKNGSFNKGITYPQAINQNYWGYHPFMRWSHTTLINDHFVVNYNVLNEIYIYDKDYKLLSKKALNSDYITKISPLNEDGKLRLINVNLQRTPEEDAYFSEVSFYCGSIFSAENNRYLRFVRLGRGIIGSDDAVRFTIILADQNLNKIKEIILDQKYSLYHYFIYKNMLCLKDKNKSNDDQFFFECYNIK